MSPLASIPPKKDLVPSWNQMPSPSDLGSYSRFVNSVPMLSEEEERSLGRTLKESGDLKAAQRLILSHLRVVVKAAREYQGYGLPQEDLIQEGNIGLMKAVKRFDPERGVRLVSYAILWIRAQMQEYILDNWRLVKIGSSKAMKKLFFGLRSMREKLGEVSESERIDQIAKKMNVSEKEVRKASVWFAAGEESLDIPLEGSDASRDLPALGLSPEDAVSLEEIERAIPAATHEAMAVLNERERSIVEARFLSDPQRTLADLAKCFDVSVERVRQLEAQALKKMRQALDPKRTNLLMLLRE